MNDYIITKDSLEADEPVSGGILGEFPLVNLTYRDEKFPGIVKMEDLICLYL